MGKESFKVGDQVSLISEMKSVTVEYIKDHSAGGGIGVVWFDRDYHVQREEFPPELLKPY